MMRGLTNALRGIGGEFELNRLVGFFGGVVYVISANVFVGYEVFWLGREFDVTAYCLAFPGGLAVVAGGTAAAISLKDRNVASSKVIEQTGAKPGEATPAGVQEVKVVNPPSDPANVQEQPAAPETDERPPYAQ